ncbi:hypothetical protein [Wenxinia marina]|uniref:Wenxma_17, whole genome shotgun sequence n=1 Tax=Wenxinia marina DSM 24838 TaxID=1123501 RepID=A0A0D0QAA5_9RHOB|nr:hypothetical protein [Wenxinia marina]KIQ67933.1 hypothetical protein Wenmar_03388 [Wenxinia marina DSM 24838]GGL76098.1 hypothetical protein GCM10011392_33350 [Wenxinia marina]
MPSLIRLYVVNCAIGFAVAAALVALLLALNVGNLGHLVTTSPDGLLAILMLWVANGIVFAGVQFGLAVMALGSEDEASGGPRGGLRQYVPIRARVPHDRPADPS